MNCFTANKYLINSKLIKNIDLSNGTSFDINFKKKNNFVDFMLELNNLK